MRCRFIRSERANHAIKLLCHVMRVPRSTYYDVVKRLDAPEPIELKWQIREIYDASKGLTATDVCWMSCVTLAIT